MVVKFPQLSCPLTAFALVRAVDSELVERLLVTLVRVVAKVGVSTVGTRRVHLANVFQAVVTKTFSTAHGLVGLAKNEVTDAALHFEEFRRRLNELALESAGSF